MIRGAYGEDYSDTIIRLASGTRWGRIDARRASRLVQKTGARIRRRRRPYARGRRHGRPISRRIRILTIPALDGCSDRDDVRSTAKRLSKLELLSCSSWRRSRARRFAHRRLSAHIEPACRSPDAQHARATLQGGSDAQRTPMAARALFRAIKDGAWPVLSRRPQRRQRTVCALLRTARALHCLSRAPRPHDGCAALCRHRIPASGRAFQHPHRAHFNAEDERQRGGRSCGDANPASPVRGFHPRGARTMDVGAPEVGLIATAITRGRSLVPRKVIVAAIIRRISRAASSALGVHDPAVLRPGGGSDTFCVVDNVLELAAARARTSWRSNGHRERRCRSKVRPLTWSGDFDAAADRLPAVDALGCLRSLRARSALDGVSWVQGG